jgi:hypothetical protein
MSNYIFPYKTFLAIISSKILEHILKNTEFCGEFCSIFEILRGEKKLI